MRRRIAVPLVTLLLAGAAIAGCGSSSSSSGSGSSSSVTPAAYVKSVCTALGPVITDLRSKLTSLSTVTTPQQAKTGFSDLLSSVTSNLGTAIPKIQAAGTPNVSNGSQIESALVNAFTQLKAAFAGVAPQVNSLPTNNAASFRTAAAAIGTKIQSSNASIQAGLKGLASPELKAAAKAEPACAPLHTTS